MQYYAVLDYAMRSHTVLHMLISEPVDLQTMADVQLFCILKTSTQCIRKLYPAIDKDLRVETSCFIFLIIATCVDRK